ncbi:MAG: helix-turn-helix domain-containing protein [Chloroflexota bacterium]|nr:helix-turn-helix domain-containing protein [Chloroflexota bacterium]
MRYADKSSFGALLKHHRLVAGLSQEALAARASLSARTISDLERGIHGTPRTDTLELLTGALSLSAQQRTLFLASARPEVAALVDAPPRSPSSIFPLPPTRLVGREQERSHALAQLRRTDTQLLTLTGPSGVGKTRLALQLVQELVPDFTDGVAFVALAPIRNAALVPGEVAQTLGIRELASSSATEQVHTFLHEKHLLLVLDNVEQILDCASFVADLLARCARLKVLVTSRTPLHLRAEQVLPLAPLLLEDAVTLFSERAQAGRPGRTYSENEVTAICEQVDRLPLAIELAAMHVKVLSLPELRKRLTHRLELLRGGAKDLPLRQQTMEGAIAWSYELLTEEQQRCFRTLGVFVGGWTLEAAEAVCWAEDEIAAKETFLTLAALIDASLVQTEMVAGGIVRFSMLELLRDYALQRLQTAGKEELIRYQHAAYYAHLAETVMKYFGPEQGVRHAQFALAQELPNAREALQWAEERHEAELGLRLAGFARLWHIRGQMSEAENWFERMLALDLWAREHGEHAAPLTQRIEKLYGLARTLVRHGKVERGAEAFAKEALQLAQSIGDQNGISNAFATLGMIAQASGKLDEAEAAFTESYTHARLAEQGGLMSRALSGLANLARMRGDVAHATALLEEALVSVQAMGMTWDIPIITTLLGHLACQQQNYTMAKARYREALTLYRTFGSPTYIASCLEGFAAAVCAEGYYAQATRLYAAANALREQTQTPLPLVEREAFEQTVATAKAALDSSSFAREWNSGTVLTQDEAIDDALSADVST